MSDQKANYCTMCATVNREDAAMCVTCGHKLREDATMSSSKEKRPRLLQVLSYIGTVDFLHLHLH